MDMQNLRSTAAAYFNYFSFDAYRYNATPHPVPNTPEEKAKIDPGNKGIKVQNIIGPFYLVPDTL